MKFGVIGFGNIARKFVRSIEHTTEGQVIAIASRSISLDDPYLIAHPKVKVYHDYEMMLDNQEVEAVYIALPHLYHKEWIIKAIKCHKAVLSEKPLVLNSQDIDDIEKYVQQYQGYCLEAFKTKFNHGFDALKKDLSLIGNIKTIETNFCSDTSHVRKGSYLFDPLQGGALNDVGSYIIGFILGLIDSPIDHIESQMKMENGIDRVFLAKLHFQNGVIGIGEGSIDYAKERYALITGEKGTIHVPIYNRIIDYTITLDDQVLKRHYPIEGDDMTLEIQALIDDVNDHYHDNRIHSLKDAKYLQQVIEQIRKEAQ